MQTEARTVTEGSVAVKPPRRVLQGTFLVVFAVLQLLFLLLLVAASVAD